MLKFGELRFLFSVYRLVMFYICTKFHENIVYGFKAMEEGMISILNITKGYNSEKIVNGIIVLNICISSNDALYLYQNLRKYLKGV